MADWSIADTTLWLMTSRLEGLVEFQFADHRAQRRLRQLRDGDDEV
jgi:hypothetical protein